MGWKSETSKFIEFIERYICYTEVVLAIINVQ